MKHSEAIGNKSKREWRFARIATACRHQTRLKQKGIETIVRGKKDGWYVIEE